METTFHYVRSIIAFKKISFSYLIICLILVLDLSAIPLWPQNPMQGRFLQWLPTENQQLRLLAMIAVALYWGEQKRWKAEEMLAWWRVGYAMGSESYVDFEHLQSDRYLRAREGISLHMPPANHFVQCPQSRAHRWSWHSSRDSCSYPEVPPPCCRSPFNSSQYSD